MLLDDDNLDLLKLNSYVDENGYYKSYLPSHPYSNKGYVHTHRLVVEAAIGIPLVPEIIVHHINFVKTDNRKINLFITTASEHAAIHNRGKRRTTAEKNKLRKTIQKNKQNIG